MWEIYSPRNSLICLSSSGSSSRGDTDLAPLFFPAVKSLPSPLDFVFFCFLLVVVLIFFTLWDGGGLK